MYSSTFKNDLKQMKVPDDMKGSIVHVVNYTVIKHSLSILWIFRDFFLRVCVSLPIILVWQLTTESDPHPPHS